MLYPPQCLSSVLFTDSTDCDPKHKETGGRSGVIGKSPGATESLFYGYIANFTSFKL